MRKVTFFRRQKAAFCLAAALVLSSLSTSVVRAEDGETEKLFAGKTILANISVGGVEVGGMTYEEALAAVGAGEEGAAGVAVELTSSVGNVSTTLSELGYSDSSEDAVLQAISLGNSGDILKRYKEIHSAETQPVDIAVERSVTAEAMEKVVNQELGDLLNGGSDGVQLVKEDDGHVKLIPGDGGIGIDVEASAAELNSILAENWTGEAIQLALNEDGNSEKVEQLSEVTDLLGEFTTDYDSAAGRMKNIERATDLINGTILYPGEEFSTSDTMGPRTTENGYYTAAQYSGGQVVQGVGGGVCQVSTTLYNAVIRAELNVTERSPHGMTVSYVKLSADAAISSGVKDLKFQNDTDAPIYIEGTYSGGKVTFRIYGKEYRPSNRTVEFESKTLSTIDPGEDVITEDASLEPGTQKVTQSAHIGYTAELWKNVYIDGVLTESTKVNSSTYRASARYVSVGPGEVATEAPTTEAPATAAPTTEAPAATEAPTPAAPATTETPATTEAPAATEAPAVTETPAATEVPAVSSEVTE